MARLIYSALTSLDGYVEDEQGRFDWAEPDEEVHTFVNDLERSIGTYLLGRRLYETMGYWDTIRLERRPPFIREFAELWRRADKVVYSRTLTTVSSARARLEPEFEPDAIRRLIATAERDLSVGGAELAAHAFAAGLVDEVRLFLSPVVVGGGKRALPDGVRLALELLDERRFANGTVYLRYGAAAGVPYDRGRRSATANERRRPPSARRSP